MLIETEILLVIKRSKKKGITYNQVNIVELKKMNKMFFFKKKIIKSKLLFCK